MAHAPRNRPERDAPEEDLDEALNPHRREQEARAAEETQGRLRERGVRLSGQESEVELADLLEAVEEFEAAVQAAGGDLMVDDLRSSEPEAPELVLPQHQVGEPVRAYIRRIQAGTARLRQRP